MQNRTSIQIICNLNNIINFKIILELKIVVTYLFPFSSIYIRADFFYCDYLNLGK